MPYFTPSGKPLNQTRGLAADVRAEFQLIQAGFAMLPVAAAIQSGAINYSADTGVADAYVAAVGALVLAYSDGLTVLFKATNANTGAATVNVNALGVKSIVRPDGTALSAGDILAGQICQISYNATTGKFQLSSAAATSAAVAAAASALAASNSASAASGSASTASTKASEAVTSASTASTKAGEAVLSAEEAAASAASIAGGPVASINGLTGVVTGIVDLTTVQSLTNKTITEIVYALTGTTPAFTATNGAVQTWTLTANSTPTDSLTTGQSIILVITPGAYTITWPSAVWTKQGGSGAAPSLFSAGKTSVVLWKVGSVLYGSHLGDTV